MTKTPRTSSYLRHITHHHDANLPLLKPSRTLTRLWGTMLPHDRATETMLPAQPTSASTGAIPLLQDIVPLSAQHAKELQPARSTTKTAQPAVGQETTSPSSALPGGSPVIEETTSTISHQQPEIQLAPAKSTRMSSSAATTELAPLVSHQQPQMEIQLVPAKSMHSIASETSRSSPATQIPFDRQTRTSGEKKPASITLRPRSGHPQEAIGIPTNNRRTTDLAEQESRTSARAFEPRRRSEVLPHKQETQQRAAIHIGTIDVHIVPPAPPLPPARSTTLSSRSTPALSREMTSFIGLRQG